MPRRSRSSARPAFAPEPLEPRVFLTAVTSFTLINADTGQPVDGYATLPNGATLDLSEVPTRRLNVRANVDPTTRSVRFGYDANANYRVESWAPFALAADGGGNYNPWTPTVGTHTVRATPFVQTGATGTAGPARAVTFHVVSGGSTRPASPPAPAGAVRLFDPSSSTAAWTRRNGGGSIAWGAAAGELTVRPGTGDVRTRETFRDFRLHLEFNTNATHASVAEQDRGNSGVGLGGSYELQVLDSYGRALSGANDAGAIYGVRDGVRNAARPAGAWQSYDVTFTAARWNGNAKVANARATVYLNGQLIHNNVEIPRSTFTFLPESPVGGPIVLQDHGNAVRYRNVWVARR